MQQHSLMYLFVFFFHVPTFLPEHDYFWSFVRKTQRELFLWEVNTREIIAVIQGYDTRFTWSFTSTRLVLTWSKLSTTDYFDTFIIMIKKCSAQHGFLLTPVTLIGLRDEFTSSALQFHVSTTIATYFWCLSTFSFNNSKSLSTMLNGFR